MGKEVTGDKVIRGEGDKVIRGEGDKVIRGEGDKVISDGNSGQRNHRPVKNGKVIYLGPLINVRSGDGSAMFTLKYGTIYKMIPSIVVERLDKDAELLKLFVPVDNVGSALKEMGRGGGAFKQAIEVVRERYRGIKRR